jgi:hypothetical protein
MNNDDVREKKVKFNGTTKDSDTEMKSVGSDDEDGVEDGGYFLNPLLLQKNGGK